MTDQPSAPSEVLADVEALPNLPDLPDLPDQPDQSDPAADEANEPGGDEAAARVGEAQVFEGKHVGARPLGPAAVIQRPHAGSDTPASSVAARIAAANAAARDHALAALAGWFPGYDFDAAAQTSDDRRFSVLTIGDSLYEYLDAIQVVERIAAHHNLTNQVVFSHGTHKGRPPKRAFDAARPNLRRLQIGPVIDSLDEQWTTIINNIDALDPAIADVSDKIGQAYGARINTNVYISFGHAEGFGQHWDEHDTIIVPAAGAKKWTVYEPTTLSPAGPWVERSVSQRPVWEGTIEPGMCLVIPRGWGHEVGGSDDLSIHYTIGVNRMTVGNIVEYAAHEGGFNPLVRADVAYDPDRPVASYEKSIHDTDESFSELVEVLTTQPVVDRAIGNHRARIPQRLFPRLFDMWTAAGANEWHSMTLRMPVPAGVQLVAVEPTAAVLAFANQQIRVTPPALELLLHLADAQPHGFADLPLEPDLRATVCRELARAGLIDVRYAP